MLLCVHEKEGRRETPYLGIICDIISSTALSLAAWPEDVQKLPES